MQNAMECKEIRKSFGNKFTSIIRLKLFYSSTKLILNKSLKFNKRKKDIRFLNERIDPTKMTKIIYKNDITAATTKRHGWRHPKI
jgi:hypothetical protein